MILKASAANGSLVVGVADGELLGLRLDALDRRHVERRREVVEHGVEQRLDALVLEGRAAEDRGERDLERRLADRLLEAVDRDVGLFEDQVDEPVVVVADLVEQVLAAPARGSSVLRRDLADDDVLAEVVLVGDGLHLDEVDDAEELGLGADRKLDRHGVGPEPVDHRLDALVEVRADAVHLVDVGDARDAVLVGLAPDRLGLRLDAGDRVEQRDRAVEDAQRALDLDGEVDVSGRVDDVDAVIGPLTGRGRGRDRDAALLLLLHPVHRGRALVDLTDLVRATGVVEDPLGGRRLTGVDVRHDADIAGLVERELTGHGSSASTSQGKENGPLGPARTAGCRTRSWRYVLERSIRERGRFRRGVRMSSATRRIDDDSSRQRAAIARSRGASRAARRAAAAAVLAGALAALAATVLPGAAHRDRRPRAAVARPHAAGTSTAPRCSRWRCSRSCCCRPRRAGPASRPP